MTGLMDAAEPVAELSRWLQKGTDWFETWKSEHFCHELFLGIKYSWDAKDISVLTFHASEEKMLVIFITVK